MAVTTASTIKFSDVCLEIYGSSLTAGRSQNQAFIDATGTFDPIYEDLKDSLLDFRGYNHEDYNLWRVGMKAERLLANTVCTMTYYNEAGTLLGTHVGTDTTVFFYHDLQGSGDAHDYKAEWEPDTGYELLNGDVGVLTNVSLLWVSGPTLTFVGATITGAYSGDKYSIRIDDIDNDFMTMPTSPSVYKVIPKQVGGANLVATLADTESPSEPTGLDFNAIEIEPGLWAYRLSWNASTDNVAVVGYKLYRDNVYQTSPGVINQLFYDVSVGSEPTGCWTVSAVDAVPNESTKPTCISWGDTEAPTIPTGLVATLIAQTTFRLAWTHSTDNVGVTGYKVYKNGGVYDPSTGYFNFLDITGQTAGVSANWSVSAYDAEANESSQSTQLNVLQGVTVTAITMSGAAQGTGALACGEAIDTIFYITGGDSFPNNGEVIYTNIGGSTKLDGSDGYYSDGSFSFQVSSTGVVSNRTVCTI